MNNAYEIQFIHYIMNAVRFCLISGLHREKVGMGGFVVFLCVCAEECLPCTVETHPHPKALHVWVGVVERKVGGTWGWGGICVCVLLRAGMTFSKHSVFFNIGIYKR